MPIQAQLADGRVLEFPDDTDTAVIQSTVQRLIRGEAMKPAAAPAGQFVPPTEDPAANLRRYQGDVEALNREISRVPEGDPRRQILQQELARATQAVNYYQGQAKPVAPTATPEPPPYKNRREALDDAVNLLEEGASQAKVKENFAKLGIAWNDIISHGQQRGSDYFKQQPIVPPPAVTAPVKEGRIAPVEVTPMQSVANAFKRADTQLSDVATSYLFQTGVSDAQATGQLLAQNARKRSAAAPSQEIQDGMVEIGSAKTFGDAAKAMLVNPRATFTMMVDSVLGSLPAMAPAMALGPAGAVARGAAAGVGSGGLEYGSVLADVLSEKGVNLLDANAVAKALSDPAVIEEAKEKGAKRGLIIGLFDGITMGMAGRFLNPAMQLVQEGKLAGRAAQRATTAAWAKEMAVQVAGGAGGEYAAQKATGENKPAEVLLEGLVELPQGIAEVRSTLRDTARAEAEAKIPTRIEPGVEKQINEALKDLEAAAGIKPPAQGEALGPETTEAVEAKEERPEAAAPTVEPTAETEEEKEQRRIADLRSKVDEDMLKQQERLAKEGIRPQVPQPIVDRTKPSLYETELPQPTSREELEAKQAEIDRLRLEAGLPTSKGVTSETKAPEFPTEPKIVDNRPLQERAAKNRLLVMQNMLKNEGGDPNSLSIVPHPTVEGKFAIQSLDRPVRLEPELPQTAITRPETPKVIDPVEAYIEIARKTNTPASARLAKDFEAGLVTREDVMQAVEAERKAGQPLPINYTSAGEPWFIAPETYRARSEETIEERRRDIEEAKKTPPKVPPAPPAPPVAKKAPTVKTTPQLEVKIPGAKKQNTDLGVAVEDNDWARTTEQLKASKNPMISTIGKMAEDLMVTTEINPNVFTGKLKNAIAGYNVKTGAIYARNKKSAANEHAIAHETVHALTVDAIRAPKPQQKAAVNRLKNLYRYVKAQLRGKRMYGLSDVEEFIAEGMSNPEFQQELAKIPYQKKTAWGAFTKAIADILGIKDSSALTEIIAITEELTKPQATEAVALEEPTAQETGKEVAPLEETERKKAILARAVPVLFSEDEIGRSRLRPGAAAYGVAANIANKVLDKMAMKPASPELASAIRDMRADVDRVQKKIGTVAKQLANISSDEREMISDVIEGELKAGVEPPKHILSIAATMQEMMTQQAEELVRLGMLSEEAAMRWENKYLPRFYQNKLRDDVKAWSTAAKNLIRKQPMMQGVVGRGLKARGIFKEILVEDLPEYEAKGWEQRDPRFDPDKSEVTTVWRDYTREERENMGEIRDAMFRFVMGYNSSQRDIALGRLYESLAKDYASESPKEGYVFVPDTSVEGTNAKRYGKLAGMYVPKEIMDHLSYNDEYIKNGLFKIYRAGLAKWKEGKTVLNPVAHANNVISNLTMAHFAGVSYWDGHKYAGAIKDLVKNADMLKEAEDVGLFTGSFNQAELVKSMPPQLRAMANMTESQLAKFGERIWDAMAYTVSYGGKKIGVRPVAQWMYENEDSFFRYLIYRDARNRGMDPKEARDYSQQYIFTYDDLPKGAQLARDFAMPFFGYVYKVIPVLARTALEYPWRYAAPATVAYGVNALMYAIAADLGGDDDDWWAKTIYKYVTDEDFRKKAKELEDTERKNLPDWMKGSSTLGTPKAIRLGVDDVTQLPLFLDISRIFPGGDLGDAHNNTGGAAMLQPLMPNNPLLTTLIAIGFNQDTFFGKPVVDKKLDTEEEKFRKRSGWLWRQVSPAIAVGNYHFDRAMNALATMTGKPITVDAGPMGVFDYTGVGKDELAVQPKYAAMQTVGIKVRPYDLDFSEKMDESDKRKMLRDLSAKISRMNRQEVSGVVSPEAAEIEREKLREKKRRLQEGLTVEGKEKD